MTSQPISTPSLSAPSWPTINRLIVNETIINILVSTPMYILFAWLTFPRDQPVPMWGLHGAAFDLIPSTFMPAIMVSLGSTLGLRLRIKKGMTAAGRFSSPLPSWLPLRLLSIGIAASIVVVPLALLALYATWHGAWTLSHLMLFKVAHAAFVSILATPFAVKAAMRFDVSP